MGARGKEKSSFSLTKFTDTNSYIEIYKNQIIKMREQFRIIELPLIIVFILIGAIFLISNSDLVSMFIAIEFQNFAAERSFFLLFLLPIYSAYYPSLTKVNLNKNKKYSNSSIKSYRPESLALDHLNSGNHTTSEIMNNLLINQQIYITQKELDDLLKIQLYNRYLGISLVNIVILFGINLFVGSWLASFYIDPTLLCAIIPIKSYSNAEVEKGKILQENKQKSGIYM
jgi:hypothetical protein